MKTNNMSIPPCQSRNRASAALPLLANPSFFYGLLTLGFFALSPTLRAVTPAPDGGYPNNNTAEGEEALFKLNLSYGNNTALGYHALHEAIGTLFNTAVGASSLAKNQDGDDNTAVGGGALAEDIHGGSNTAVGASALENTTASDNTAVGEQALRYNTSGTGNTAVGSRALSAGVVSVATGSYNTANGALSLVSNTTGYSNVANGWQALYSNKVGAHNSATGAEALYTNTADFNTAAGSRALYTNSTGNSNTASGYATLYNNTSGSSNTAVGTAALTYNTTGSNNVAIGRDAGTNLTTGSNNIVIGAGLLGNSADTNVTRIGKTTQKKVFIGGIYGIAEPAGSGIKPVYINSNGQLGTTPPASSARFKELIKPMEKASEGILSLKPVTFRYKDDTERTPQFGLIAEEVAKANPDLVVRDDNGQIYTVRYEAVNAMLLNEFLKEHRTVQELKATLAQQQKQIETLTAGLQKVTARVETSKPAQRVVSGD